MKSYHEFGFTASLAILSHRLASYIYNLRDENPKFFQKVNDQLYLESDNRFTSLWMSLNNYKLFLDYNFNEAMKTNLW